MKEKLERILSFFVIIITVITFVLPINRIYAASSTYTQTLKSGIDKFSVEYQEILNQIKTLHPNWNFEAYYTGMDWDTVVLNETAVHGRNRVIVSSEEAWKCNCGDVASGYICASEGIIKYYLDPRNFLNEVNIFQFLEISYNSKIHTLEGIKSSVKNTFLDSSITYTVFEEQEVKNEETGELEKKSVEKSYTKTYSEIILEAAQKSNMSPYSIVAKIIQEVGNSGSNSVSGTYEGYKGYYNFYNLGAYDTGNAIENGLKYARDKGWNNQYVAIIDGAKEIANSYTNAGQNTAYFYKWDVVGTKILNSGDTQVVSSSNMFWHQYMTNVQDPTSQSKNLYNTYAKNGVLDEALNFIIPIYNNMPDKVAMPTGLTINDGNLYYVNATDGLTIRQTPSIYGTRLTALYKDTVVVVLERECIEADGYKWDKVRLSNGIIGYAASKYLVLKNEMVQKTTDNESKNSIEETVEKKEEIKEQEITSNLYKINSENKNIIVLPGTTLTQINATGEMKTGGIITLNQNEYTAVIKGDTNGDGKASAADYVLIKNHIMQTKELTGADKILAADVNNDGKISAADYVLIKNYIMNGINFNL